MDIHVFDPDNLNITAFQDNEGYMYLDAYAVNQLLVDDAHPMTIEQMLNELSESPVNFNFNFSDDDFEYPKLLEYGSYCLAHIELVSMFLLLKSLVEESLLAESMTIQLMSIGIKNSME